MCCVVIFFFFKQKTAYEMRISDWSSDVCSSDLRAGVEARSRFAKNRRGKSSESRHCAQLWKNAASHLMPLIFMWESMQVLLAAGEKYKIKAAQRKEAFEKEQSAKIGRASGRERVCQ